MAGVTVLQKSLQKLVHFILKATGTISDFTSVSEFTVPVKMAAPDELFCWEGDWGLPSIQTDCLVVLVSVRPDRTRSPPARQCRSGTEADRTVRC